LPVLLVAATGGHLAQLHRLAPRIPGAEDGMIWATFDTPQSRSLLEGETCVFVPFTASRDFRTALRNTRPAAAIIRRARPSLVASTGNAIALSFLPVARLAGIPTAYIESAARADGPSLTGRLLRSIPGVQLFSQYPGWALPPWRYAGSVFDEFDGVAQELPQTVRRVLVTLGTIGFGFRRLVERILAILPDDCDVVWQVGATNVDGLGITSCVNMPSSALQSEMRRADVVIAHAGIGSALASLDAGKRPILVPRERRQREHVDDHQQQIARTLADRNLAVHRPVATLATADLLQAARWTVVQHTTPTRLAIAS
jgi:UDP-N-acetylglucosamine--N-acetylmuramyl-(pentapeptide) pyrophosphoryl-undecaprenol N-acetylglucosamine transferase